jgi:hypothetical protein
MQRLQAKLILKGLFLLSLEGNGTTAGEIAAAMLIFDENDPASAVKSVEELLETFVAAVPDEIQRVQVESRETQYSLRVSNKENLNNALTEAIETVAPDDIVPKVLRRVARERFADWTINDNAENAGFDSTDLQIVWRGGLRRGRLIWNLETGGDRTELPPADATFTNGKLSSPNRPKSRRKRWACRGCTGSPRRSLRMRPTRFCVIRFC